MQGELAGKPLNELHGITATKGGHVIIADGNNSRLLILDSSTGELINKHDLLEYSHAIQPHLINNDKELVLHYTYQGKKRIAYYSIQ